MTEDTPKPVPIAGTGRRLTPIVPKPRVVEEYRRTEAEAAPPNSDPLPPEVGEAIPEGVGEDEIPDALKPFAQGEAAADFRERAFKLLQRFGVEDGQHGPDTLPLTQDEKILVVEMVAANGAAGNWLRVDLSKLS